MTVVFPALKKLWLEHMPNLTKWADVESGVATFPCLEYLQIKSCHRLESVPSRFPSLRKLIVEEIGSNVSLTNICTNTYSLQSLEIYSYSGIIHYSDLQDSNTLLHRVRSLQILLIVNCPKLNSIPNFELRSLRELAIRNCPALTYLPVELLESCTHSLEWLTLEDLPIVENMDAVMSCISRMSSLQRLSLLILPNLTSLPMEIGCLRGLWMLDLGKFSKSVDQVSFNNFLQLVLNEAPRLQMLMIIGHEGWGSLPDHIQHLFLYELRIDGYGIEALPEWIGNFSSLQRLIIWNCKRLRHLPSKGTMQRLTKLSHLWIKRCPLLRTRQERTSGGTECDSEWHKISHIQYVQVDNEILPTINSTAEKKLVNFFATPQRYTD